MFCRLHLYIACAMCTCSSFAWCLVAVSVRTVFSAAIVLHEHYSSTVAHQRSHLLQQAASILGVLDSLFYLLFAQRVHNLRIVSSVQLLCISNGTVTADCPHNHVESISQVQNNNLEKGHAHTGHDKSWVHTNVANDEEARRLPSDSAQARRHSRVRPKSSFR